MGLVFFLWYMVVFLVVFGGGFGVVGHGDGALVPIGCGALQCDGVIMSWCW